MRAKAKRKLSMSPAYSTLEIKRVMMQQNNRSILLLKKFWIFNF